MGSRRGFTIGLFVMLVLLVSCLQGAKAPRVTASRTLDLELQEAGNGGSKRPFAVVFSGPQGATVEPSEVSIVFNRPMRALDLAEQEAAPPAKIVVKGTTTSPKGAWRWMGTSALIFAPDPRLAHATDFVVTVPADTKALDGSVLGKEHTFSFSTQVPSLERAEQTAKSGDAQHLTPKASFELRFSQPVEPREVERAVRLQLGDGKTARRAAFKAAWPKSDTKTLIKLTPSQPLPLDTPVAIVVDKSLHGMEGPLPTGEEQHFSFMTYGPITASQVECYKGTPHGKCAAHGYVSISFSNNVSVPELKAHVKVEGAPITWSGFSDARSLRYVGLNPKLQPAQRYAVVITAGLKDEYGQTLARELRMPFETDDEWPSLDIGVRGSVIESKGTVREIPIGAMNVPSYDLATGALDEAGVVRATREGTMRFDDAKRMAGVKAESVQSGAAPNATAVKMVRIDTLLAARKGKGAALVAVHHNANTKHAFDDVRVLAVTDLAISAKMSRFGSLVWVTHLSDASPAGGAIVSVRNATGEVFSTKADANGIATIPADKYSPINESGSEDNSAVLFAHAGDDWTWRAVRDVLSPWQYAPSVDPSGRMIPMGMLFTDRGIYKAGETIRAKGLFRVAQVRGTATPKGRDVKIEAYDSNGTKMFEQATKLGAFGQVAVDVPIPATARLGSVELRAEMPAADGALSGSANAVVQLATYRPAELKVGVETDKPSYVRGEKASFTVRGDYLFGAPMTGGKLHYTVTRGAGSFTPPASEDFVLNDDSYAWALADASPRAGEFQSGDGEIGPKGTFAGSTALVMPHTQGPEVVSFEAEVEDVSRQTVAGRASVIVHPGEFYVGLKPAADIFVKKGTNLRPELAAIEPSGRRRAGVALHVELIKRSWQSVVEADGEDGHYQSRVTDKIIAACDAKSTATTTTCDLVVNDAGYFILRASAKDPRGNPVASSSYAYVLGDGDFGWSMDDTSKLELVTDKKSYEVGDVARILVKSPFKDADALVTVERAGVYTQERMALSGAMPTIRVPVTEDLRPNAFVSVHLVRGRTKAAPARGADVGAPAFRLGYAEISVNPEARRLKVAIAPSKKDYRPGEEVDADIAVSDRAGKGARGEVTFYAVDEGVLMLTGYKTPDPIPTFTAPRALNVLSLESREALARILFDAKGVGTDKGDEGGGGGGATREDFRSTAYFEPSVTTDASGKAHVHFKLPDSLTTYRLMAVVASEDDKFGFGESQITTSRKLMARPNLPRFMRAGDSIDAGVVLSSKNMGPANVEVSIEASGVEVRGDAKRVVALPANGTVEVRWAMVSSKAGAASISFHAKAGDARDDVKVTREVEAPMSLEAVALYGETTTAIAEKLGDLSQMRDDSGGLDLRLGSTALMGLDDGIEQLIEYPYGCTEQLTSRLVPLLPLRALAKDYHIALPKDLDGVVDKAVAKILVNQREDGGFGYWPDSPRSDAWVSAYALWGLTLVKQHGTHLPDGALENATRYVRRSLEEELRHHQAVGGATSAFMLDVLAMAGDPDTGYANRLYEERAHLPLFARALLAHAMVLSKMDPKQAAELTRDFEAHLRVTPAGATVTENLGDEYAVILDSEARTTAMVIRALIAIDPNHPLASRLAKGLLAARKGGEWRSTQETAWALLALDDYRRAQEKDAPSFDANVFLGDQLLLTTPFHERSATTHTASFGAPKLFAAGASGATLAFQVQGSGKLFYEARLRYAKKEMPTTGLDRGFYVRKIVRSVRPEALRDALGTLPQTSATSANGSDLVLVDLIVVTPDPREQVVIDDPLPAGLEAVQANLATTAQSLDVTNAGGAGDDADARSDDDVASERAYGFAWYHREVHDDRVLTFVDHMPAGMFHYRYLARATTFGHFVVPPTRAECMYEPETFGRTAASTFDVTPASK